MPFDSNGIWSLTPGYMAVTGNTILPLNHNPPLEDIRDNGLSAVLVRDGRAPMTGTLNMNSNKISNLLAGTAGTDAVNLTQVRTLAGTFGFLYGLTLANTPSDTTNGIDIAAGYAASDDPTAPIVMALSSLLTKKLNSAWAVGSGNGGLDTGSIANTTYHVWLIQRSDTGVVDALFSTSATAPTMPTNYDRKRRIGSIVRVSAAIKLFTQNGDDFSWISGALDRNSVASVTNVLLALTVPSGIRVQPWIVESIASGASSNVTTSVGNGDGTNAVIQILSSTNSDIKTGTITRGITTNTSGQIRYSMNVTVGSISNQTTSTLGYTDTRGRT